MKKLKFGLCGFYGYGNFGDELFYWVFEQYLGDIIEFEVVHENLYKPYFNQSIEERIKDYDALIIGGGDIVQPWGIDERYFSQHFRHKKMYVCGVGVPIRVNSKELHKEWIIDKYKNIFQSKNMQFVHARDKQSKDWIENYLEPKVNVRLAPDIVCSLDMPQINKKEKTLGIITRYRPVDDLDDYTKLEELAQYAQSKGWTIRQIILGSDNVGMRDFENSFNFKVEKKEVIYTQSLSEMVKEVGMCTAIASMKFHGTVVATMQGVPSIVLIPTSKNRNFMRRVGLDNQLSKFDSDQLINIFNQLPSHIDNTKVKSLKLEATSLMISLRQKILEDFSIQIFDKNI
jgi:polysaccharide pyruvyl transferase WcaK-like protein